MTILNNKRIKTSPILLRSTILGILKPWGTWENITPNLLKR